jgi:hypothetical protein
MAVRCIARPFALLMAVLGAPLARADAQGCAPGMTGASLNRLTRQEQASGWRLLFDGRTMGAWRGFRQEEVPAGWKVVDGTISRVGSGADLITREQFDNFELSLEWRIATGGNSGILYRVTEEDNDTYRTGPEMQVLDDAGHPDGRSRLTAAGSLFGLYPAPDGVARPAGQWNTARIVVNGNRVQHWLNGVKAVEYELLSPAWQQKVTASKFAEWPRYGRAARGHIALQDHGDLVSYRNIKIRTLP